MRHSMSTIIVRRELNRFECVLPFCYKFSSAINPTTRHRSLSRDVPTPMPTPTPTPTPISQSKPQLVRQSAANVANVGQTRNVRISQKLEENPFFAKYSNKLKNALNDSNDSKPMTQNIETNKLFQHKHKPKESSDSDSSLDSPNWPNSVKLNANPNQSLDDVLKLDLLSDKTAEEIADIWNSYYSNKDCIYAVIPADTYDRIFSMASKYKTFVLVLPRTHTQGTGGGESGEGGEGQVGNSYQLILSQFKDHKCFLTPLSAYQRHRELAPVCLTISHFPELQRHKRIVLMVGQYDPKVLNSSEAQCLANQLQWYYSADQNVRQSILLHRFNYEPNLFDHLDLIREFETNVMADCLSSPSPLSQNKP